MKAMIVHKLKLEQGGRNGVGLRIGGIQEDRDGHPYHE